MCLSNSTCFYKYETRSRSKSQEESLGGLCTGLPFDQRSCEVDSCPGKCPFFETLVKAPSK
mgnify:CR=1 FL=1